MLVFIVAVIATPVPIQKRQESSEPSEPSEPSDAQSNQNSQNGVDPCKEPALEDKVPTTSEGEDIKVYGCV